MNTNAFESCCETSENSDSTLHPPRSSASEAPDTYKAGGVRLFLDGVAQSQARSGQAEAALVVTPRMTANAEH